MSHTAFLNTLAAVCEATERIPIPRYPPPPNCYSGYAETSGATEAMVPYQPSILYYHQPEYALPSRYYSSPLQNTRVFQQFLDDTWPEETLRRGSAVIRNKLYEKIVETLQGGEATVRFKRWVKKWEFFFMHGESGTLDGLRGACLAVPAPKARGNSGRYAPIARHSHKLVACLEDFGQIIAKYHNDQKGHRGIQRTYAMVSERCMWVGEPGLISFLENCIIYSSKYITAYQPELFTNIDVN